MRARLFLFTLVLKVMQTNLSETSSFKLLETSINKEMVVLFSVFFLGEEFDSLIQNPIKILWGNRIFTFKIKTVRYARDPLIFLRIVIERSESKQKYSVTLEFIFRGKTKNKKGSSFQSKTHRSYRPSSSIRRRMFSLLSSFLSFILSSLFCLWKKWRR